MVAGAWIELDEPEREHYWSEFISRFNFKPEARVHLSPAINDPIPSVTFELSMPKAGGFGSGEVATKAFEAAVLYSLIRAFRPDQAVIAMEYYSSSYRFWPHRLAIEPEPWLVEPWLGDVYTILMSDDLTTGMFVYVQMGTLCIFGRPLIDTLAVDLLTWLPVIRIDGKPASVDWTNPFLNTPDER
jgi:Protein of unknown function (DUF2716)